MTAPLTVHNANVTTAAVEVKTLTISGKQVTLAVFRQLIEEPLINDDDGTLNGVPWGTVNYHPDKCAGDPKHYHVVWQKGDDLRRAGPRSATDGGYLDGLLWTDSTDLLYRAAVCLSADHQGPSWARLRRGDGIYEFAVDGYGCLAAPVRGEHPVSECFGQADLDAARIAIPAEIEAHKHTAARRQAAWAALESLPQLFIAV